jgi:hypothetical protein
MVVIYILAGLLLALAIVILVKNLPLHWRGALLAGIISLWLWGMAFALADYIAFCRLARFAMGAPARGTDAMAGCLVTSTSVNTVTVPLLILCSIIFFIHRPRAVTSPINPPAHL